MHLYPEKLATDEAIRSEVDLVIQLPAICAIANEFLAIPRLPKGEADVCDEILLRMVRRVGPALRTQLSERLAHIESGPRLTVRHLAFDRTPSVGVPVLRYSPLISEEDICKIAKLASSERRSDAHLLAIAKRRRLSTRAIDALATTLIRRSYAALSRDLARCRSAPVSRDPVDAYRPIQAKVGGTARQWCA